MKIDKHILVIDKNICKNIKLIKATGERGFSSQNIMNELRNFVEHIALKIYNHDNDVDLEWNFDNLDLGKKYIYENANYIFLRKFHQLLQPSASHYTLGENNSERLMLKYYEYLLKIKIFLNNNYGFYVLENLNDFPLNMDTMYEEYYSRIANVIDNPI